MRRPASFAPGDAPVAPATDAPGRVSSTQAAQRGEASLQLAGSDTSEASRRCGHVMGQRGDLGRPGLTRRGTAEVRHVAKPDHMGIVAESLSSRPTRRLERTAWVVSTCRLKRPGWRDTRQRRGDGPARYRRPCRRAGIEQVARASRLPWLAASHGAGLQLG